MAITSLNQLDVYKIVHDFDRDHFQIANPKDQLDRVFVIIQFGRKLQSCLPVELINEIMRLYLEKSPSVITLLMLYNTPAIVMLHPLPLSSNTRYINTASQSLLVRLNQTSANGEHSSYQQLMKWVFTHHFEKLQPDQKIELIQKSCIMPQEQKSASQKPDLLGRILGPTLSSQVKTKLQLLPWKVKSAAANGGIEHAVVSAMFAPGLAAILGLGLLWAFGCVLPSTTYAFLKNPLLKPLKKICELNLLGSFCSPIIIIIAALPIVFFGAVLQARIFPTYLQEIGFWMCSIAFLCSPFNDAETHNKKIEERSELKNELIKSITVFAKEHFPDLLNEWLNLTMPNDTNTGSLQKLP